MGGKIGVDKQNQNLEEMLDFNILNIPKNFNQENKIPDNIKYNIKVQTLKKKIKIIFISFY